MGLIKFIKTWTLPLSITFGAVIYLIFAFTPCLLSAAMLFAPFFNAILPLFMFLVLFVTFCKVDFKKLRVTRWQWLRSCGTIQHHSNSFSTHIAVGKKWF